MSRWITLNWRQVDWSRTALLVALILACAAALWQWAMPEIREVSSTTFRRVPEIREVEKVRRVHVPCPERGVVALDRAEVAQRLGLEWLMPVPGGDIAGAQEAEAEAEGTQGAEGAKRTAGPAGADAVSAAVLDELVAKEGTPERDEGLEVLATAELPESSNGYDVLALFSPVSGVTRLAAQEHDSPWWQWRNKYGAGIRYGVQVGDGMPGYSGALYGFWEFLRIKDTYLTGYGELNTGGQGKVQADLQWRPR